MKAMPAFPRSSGVGVFGRVAPPAHTAARVVESEEHWRHKGVQYLNTHSFGDIDDELDVRVVVVIGSAGTGT